MEGTTAAHPASPLRLPGFFFKPTDEMLVTYYLRRHIAGQSLPPGLVVPADVYGTEPWNLVGQEGREEGYYFALRVRTSIKAKRPSRIAGAGSWQAFKKDEMIKSAVDGNGLVTVGVKHSLSFKYDGKKSNGWIMYEFVLRSDQGGQGSFQEQVLCHIKKSEQAKNRTRRNEETERDQLRGNDADTGAPASTSSRPISVAEDAGRRWHKRHKVMLLPPTLTTDQVQQFIAEEMLIESKYNNDADTGAASTSSHPIFAAEGAGKQHEEEIIPLPPASITEREVTMEEIFELLDGENQQESELMQLPSMPCEQHDQSFDHWQQDNQITSLEQGANNATTFSPSRIEQQQQQELLPPSTSSANNGVAWSTSLHPIVKAEPAGSQENEEEEVMSFPESPITDQDLTVETVLEFLDRQEVEQPDWQLIQLPAMSYEQHDQSCDQWQQGNQPTGSEQQEEQLPAGTSSVDQVSPSRNGASAGAQSFALTHPFDDVDCLEMMQQPHAAPEYDGWWWC